MSADPFAIFETPKGDVKSPKKAADFGDDANRNTDLLIPDFSEESVQARPTPAKLLSTKTPSDVFKGENEVLFDAEMDPNVQDDDFGDFETAEAERSHGGADISISSGPGVSQQFSQKPSNLIDFNGNLDNFLALRQAASARSPGDDSAGTSVTVSGKQPQNIDLPSFSIEEQRTADVKDEVEDEWEPFEDGQVENAPHNNESSAEPIVNESPQTPVPVDEPRPNNVPPPAILLGILPQIFQKMKDDAPQTSASQQKSISRVYNVAARLIAGRALRWKRDSILSQSMKIGPAAAGRKGGGMKLASVDKSESRKEEREAGEAVHTWQQLAHSFNRSFKQAKNQLGPMTLSIDMKIQTLKDASTISSNHACALCGLKRDERLVGAVSEVEDSFGEFWVEQWGHRDCRDFWSRYKNLLQTR